MSPFLAWDDFHARSRFARSTIPEEKWGTTRSLNGNLQKYNKRQKENVIRMVHKTSKTPYSDRPPIVVIKMFEITKDLNLKKSKSNYYTLAINMQG